MDCQSQFIITFAVVKNHMSIWVILLSISTAGHAHESPDPIPSKGILDLRNSVMDQHSFHNLNGEWEFYWEQLLTPENFRTGKKGWEEESSLPSPLTGTIMSSKEKNFLVMVTGHTP